MMFKWAWRGFLVLSILLCFKANYSLFLVEGQSMEPFLRDGDLVLCRKNDFPIERGAVYVLHHQTLWIKRLVAGPGETLCFLGNGLITIDGLPYRIGHFGTTGCASTPKGYFFLGDRLNRSTDSRHFGPIPADKIFCRVVIVF